MFEIGKAYRINSIVFGDEGWMEEFGVWTVVEEQGSLIKISNDAYPDRIVNTASWHFVSAELAE